MNRRQLRTENGILAVLHFLGVFNSFEGSGFYFSNVIIIVSNLEGGYERTNTDSRSTEVVNFIDFQYGIYLSTGGEYVVHTICRDSVKTASEGIELYHIKVIPCFYIAGSSVKP